VICNGCIDAGASVSVYSPDSAVIVNLPLAKRDVSTYQQDAVDPVTIIIW